MISSMESTSPSSSFFATFQQAYQDWVRRFIIDDDPYDALDMQELVEENAAQIHGIESTELV